MAFSRPRPLYIVFIVLGVLLLLSVSHVPSHLDVDSLFSSSGSSTPSAHGHGHGTYANNGQGKGKGHIRETSIPGGAVAHGFTVLDRLYVREGVLYIVTENPGDFPKREHLLSVATGILGDHDEPTDEQLQFLRPDEARTVLDLDHIEFKGTSVIIYDSTFLTHYYHWWGEVILGFWRVYSKLSVKGQPLPVARFILPFADQTQWRDPPNVDGVLMRAAFPDSPIEASDLWRDMKDSHRTYAFERAILINRAAAHRHHLGALWFKMIGSTMTVPVPADFWRPIRESVLGNLIGAVPNVFARKPLVVYVSRQRTKTRYLLPADHIGLVRALETMAREIDCDFRMVEFETLTIREQIDIVSKATVLVGVHGNGMSHQLWMTPSPKSTVIEIFRPQGFAYDYEMLARNMGHKHFVMWNDTYHNYPIDQPISAFGMGGEGHGYNMPVHGPAVAQLIKERLA